MKKSLFKIMLIFSIIFGLEYCDVKATDVDNGKNVTIEDGLYEIETGVDSNKVLDVIDASMISGGNVQIFTRNNSADCQKVKIKNTGNGYYTITFVHSNMLLDVANGKKADHTNVWQCRNNGADAQKWTIKDAGNGYFFIISKLSNTYLTVSNGGTANCTNIEICSENGKMSQKFRLNKREPIKGKKTIDDGIYEIETGVASNKVLDVINASKASGGNVQVFTRNTSADCQKVKVKYIGDGYYTIAFVHSNMMLDVANGKKTDHTNVWQCTPNGTDAQKWIIQELDDEYYNIISKLSNTNLTVAGGKTTNCTNIEIDSKQNNNSQKFKFNRIDNNSNNNEIQNTNNQINETDANIEEGLYEIETALDSNKVLDVINASKVSGGNVQLFTRNKANCQKIIINKDSNGYYTLKFLHSEMLLDVSNGITANHTNVWQCRSNGADAQKWSIKNAGNGYYYLVSKLSGTYLTVAGGKTANCTNIEINAKQNNTSQKFKLNKLDEIYGIRTISDGLYEIETGVDSNKVLDVINANTVSGGNVQIYTKNNANCQKVIVKYLGEGLYSLTFLHSEMLLDVSNGITANHTNVWQCRSNGADAQKWIIKDVGNGYYNIISYLSKTYLTVAGGKTANCTNIEINSKQNNNSQKFKFNETEPNYKININTSKYPGYKELIETLQNKHPNWEFKLLYTGLNFSEAVYGEYINHGANTVPLSSGSEWICPVCGTKTYDTGNWYCASDKAIAYYMDPRNFINENNVFQFLDANKYESTSVSVDAIQANVNGTFLANYANDINKACRNQGVNPYYVISRLIQENGKNGSYTSNGMDGGDGKTYYNPFNIGAYKTANATVKQNALAKAKANGWDTMEKALEGGIVFLKTNWLENYQNTLYQNKFDIDSTNGSSLYSHQYMQNLSAAYSEGNLLKGYYIKADKIDTHLTFIIPVYEGMSKTFATRPSEGSNSEEYPMNFVVNTSNSSLALRSSANTSSTVIARYDKGTVILSIKRGINSSWQQVVTKDGKTRIYVWRILKTSKRRMEM